MRRRRTLRWLLLLAVVGGIGVAPGLQGSLEWTGVATTTWMPVLTLAAAWSPRRARTVGGLTIVVGGFVVAVGVLVVLDRALVTGFDGFTGSPLSRSFPALAAPAALLFVIFLQVTMVFERRPFDRLGGVRGGSVALVVCVGAAVAAYLTLVNWAPLTAATRPAGLRDPGGPVAGGDVITWLSVLSGWQVIVMVVLDGWPGRLVRDPVGRIAINNVVTLGGTAASYWLLGKADLDAPVVAALGACVVAGGRLPFCLYVDGVDPRGTLPARCRQGAAGTAAVSGVLWLIASRGSFTVQPRALWIAVTALNLVSGGITFASSVAGPPLDRLCPRRAAAGRSAWRGTEGSV